MNVPWALRKKNMYSVAVLNMFVSLSYHSVMVFSLVFCMNDLHANKSGIINPSTVVFFLFLPSVLSIFVHVAQ